MKFLLPILLIIGFLYILSKNEDYLGFMCSNDCQCKTNTHDINDIKKSVNKNQTDNNTSTYQKGK